MFVLQIVTPQRKPLAEIRWQAPGKVTWELFEPACEADVKAFVKRAQSEGVPFRTASRIKQAGESKIVQQQLTIKANDERFLKALSDRVMRYSFGGQRAFGLLKKT